MVAFYRAMHGQDSWYATSDHDVGYIAGTAFGMGVFVGVMNLLMSIARIRDGLL